MPTHPSSAASAARPFVRRAVWLPAVILAAVASAAEPIQLAESRRVRIEVEPESGVITAHVDGVREPLTIASIALDGAVQTGYRAERNATASIAGNDRISVSGESLGEASAVLVLRAADGAAHDWTLQIRDTSDYYGGGERFHALNQKGYILPMISADRPEAKGVSTYKPVPLLMSTRGYGLWIDSHHTGRWDLNASDRFHVILEHDDASELRVVLIAGPSPAALLDEYTRLSGRPHLPPGWAFAPWKSRDVHRSGAEVLEDVEKHRALHLPASVIVIDSPWETCYNDFNLNEQQFADPEALFHRVRELGFYPCFWLTPFVNTRNVVDMHGITPHVCNTYTDALARGFLVRRSDGSPHSAEWWKGEGALIDFTHPEAVEWWHAQLERTLRWGARAFKCDDGEGNFVGDAVFHDGSPAVEMRNRYALLYNQAMQRFVDERLDGDGVLICRSGAAGAQRFPFGWAGDNYADYSPANGLPGVILAGQTAALSGMPFWGHDIAGYMGTPDKELFIRWTQFGAFSPLMMVHMQSNLGPWDFDDETLDIYRRYARLHTGLFPYIYAAAREATRSGMPIIRPMAFAFPDDPRAATHVYQYLFGPDLLVAPMAFGGSRRVVYLPAGQWIEYWSGAVHQGPRTLEVDAPLAQIPLFVRGGAVLVMLPEDVDTLIPRHEHMSRDVVAIDDRRIVQIWPGVGAPSTSVDGLEIDRPGDQAAERTLRLRLDSTFSVELQWPWSSPSDVMVNAAPLAVGRDASGLYRLPLGPIESEVLITWREP